MVEEQGFEKLPFVDVKRKLATGKRDEVVFSAMGFCTGFGLTHDELLAELLSGRLTAQGIPQPGGGYANICITWDAAVQWAALTERGARALQYLAEKPKH